MQEIETEKVTFEVEAEESEYLKQGNGRRGG